MDKEKYISFYTPNYVYTTYDNVSKLKLRKNNSVYCGELLGQMNNGINIYSTISGVIKGNTKLASEDKIVDLLVIENDYKDKCFKIIGGKEKFNYYKRKEANKILKNFNINKSFKGKKYLMVDLLTTKNHLENKYISLDKHFELLETIGSLLTIYNLNISYIAVNDNETKDMLKKYSGMYPNIKFVSRVIKNDSTFYYNGYEIMKIYNALKFNKLLTEKFYTIVNLKEIYIVKSKINIKIDELINFLNINFNHLTILNYKNEKINKYEGLLTENIKTIIIS